MARRRTPDEVKRFDLAKYTILITLILLFIILFIIRSIQNVEPAAEETIVGTTPIPTYTIEPDIEAPSIMSPASGAVIEAGALSFSGRGTPGSRPRGPAS